MTTDIEQQTLAKIENLIKEYEADLTCLHNRRMDSFDKTQLPDVIQQMVSLATTQSSSFSNVAAVTVANFTLGHLFGQARCAINDPVYSPDRIVANVYAVLIARSGNGKDRVQKALMKSCQKAFSYVATIKKDEEDEKARVAYVKRMQRENPQFNEAEVVPDDYLDPYAEEEELITNMESSRGGLTKLLNTLERSEYGIASIFESELGMSIQSNTKVMESVSLMSTLFDMGISSKPAFKTDEAQERSVKGMFPNLLGVSSPAPFYMDGPVRKLFVPMVKTALGRRVTLVFSTAKEEFENMYIPETLAEGRELQYQAELDVHRITDELNAQMLVAIENAIGDNTVMFDDEASKLYRDYIGYTKLRSKKMLLQNGDSIEGLELDGRAFKMGRIACLWALAQDKRVIDYDTLLSAIYFVDYTAQHLVHFTKTMDMNPYELLINDWQQGFFGNSLPLDKAITNGYLNTKQVTKQAIEGFLKPVNSKLTGKATVSYNESSNTFVFLPVVTINPEDAYSYRAIRGISDERPIHTVQENKAMSILPKLLVADSSFNPFKDDTTKFVVLNVSKSFLSIGMINKYLADVHHFIATDVDADDNHSFNIIIPVNNVITKSEYKFVCLSIANQLMLKILPENHEAESTYHGHTGANLLTGGDSAKLFDCGGILANYASGGDAPILTGKSSAKPTKAVVDKYVKDDVIANKQLFIDMVDASDTPLLLFAGLVYDMHCNYVAEERIGDIVDNLNSKLEISITEAVKDEYIIAPFKDT